MSYIRKIIELCKLGAGRQRRSRRWWWWWFKTEFNKKSKQ